MKKLIFASALLILAVPASAQQVEIDSLVNRISRYPAEDSVLVDLRNDYAKRSLLLNPADTSLISFSRATLNMAEKLGYPKGILQSNERLGVLYQYAVSDPYLAMDYYQRALNMIQNHPVLKKYTTGITGNIGNIYYEQEEYQKALGYFKQVLNDSNEMELPATANIANIYGKLNKPDSSVYYFNKAITLAKEQNNLVFLANCLSNLSLVRHSTGDTDQAKKDIEESLALIHAHRLEYVRSMAYANAATIYLADKNYRKAGIYARDALNCESSLNNLSVRMAVWGTLAEVYEAENQYKKSLNAYKMYFSLKDSLTSQDRKVEVSRKEMQYEYDTREALLKAENEKRQALAQVEISKQKTIKNAYIFSGSGLLFAALFGIGLYKRKRDAVEQKQEAEFKAVVADTELKALRAQMNPHFIFNSLSSIGDYMLKNDTESAYNYMTQFARLMRQTLENSNRKEITLDDDLQFTELYLQVENKRLNHQFTYDIKVDETIDRQNTLIPPLMLQPFIENSIWHGISKKDGNGHILIEIKKNDNRLICSVDDNGAGLNNLNNQEIQNTGKNQSLGVQITESRLAILNKQKQIKGQLKILDKNGEGVRVEISLPLLLAF